jgi:hypothetical protein
VIARFLMHLSLAGITNWPSADQQSLPGIIMSDVFTTTQRTGFFSRIKNAIFGTFLGLIMVPVSVGLLSWNEYRTIHRTHGLNEGAKVVESVDDPNSVSRDLAGSLIHLNGRADTQERLRDDIFGVEENAIRLKRKTQMYQWVEEKRTRKNGNTKKTTYTYNKEWESGRVDHGGFKRPEGHENPSARFSRATWEAKEVNLGAYALNARLIGSIHSGEHVAWSQEIVDALPQDIRDHSVVSQDYLYWSKAGVPNPESPQLGDQRIQLNIVRPTQVSRVAQSREKDPTQLGPFKTTNGEELERLYVGDFSAAEVFEKMQGENNMWAWIFRGIGFAVSLIGFSMIMGVLSAFADSLPFVGSMTRSIIGFVAFLLAIVLTTLTIAFAWVAVRPLLAIPLIVVGIGAAIMAWRSSRKKPTSQPGFAKSEAPAVLSADDLVR